MARHTVYAVFGGILAALLVTTSGQAGTPAVSAHRRHPLLQMPIAARVVVPKGPAWLETGFGSVWVAKILSKEVLRIDPVSNQVIAHIPVGTEPELGMGMGFGSVWVPDIQDHTITQIDPLTNTVRRVIPVDLAPYAEGSIGVGEGSLWAITSSRDTDAATLTRLDPESGAVIARIPVHPKSHGVLVAFGAVWVTSTGSSLLTRIDPKTNTVAAEIPVPRQPLFLAGGEGSVWVLSQGEGSLARIDPATNRVVANLPLGVSGEGGDLSINAGYVWVSAEGTPLTQIDPATNQVLGQYYGGQHLDTMRVGFGAVWLVDELHGQIWRVPVAKLRRARRPR
jgi:YVTN family beta-propeller protein